MRDERRSMNDDDAAAAVFAAVDVAQSQGPPDDAPICDEPNCDRLGVITQTVATSTSTRVWHWCVTHDPERA